MIGTKHWATGIIVDYQEGKWSSHVEYLDDGFADYDLHSGRISTEGRIGTRYGVRDSDHHDALTVVIDVMKADAERLGIEWRKTIGGPYIFAAFETAAENYPDRYPDGWQRLLNEQSRRIGFNAFYSVPASIRTERTPPWPFTG